MKKLLTCMFALILLVVCFERSTTCMAETVSRNPLIDPKEVEAVDPEHRFTNILLLGIEYGFDGYRNSAATRKGSLQNSHTDSIMVASINMTTN